MSLTIKTCHTKSVKAVINQITWSSALMILEKIPQKYMTQQETETLIRFEPFNSGEDFDIWQKGRIFDKDKELTWEIQNNLDFKVVYTGSELDLSGMNTLEVPWIKDITGSDNETGYFLWGQKLSHNQQKANNIYSELQIPRLLKYPLTAQKNKSRLILKVQLFRDKSSNIIRHFRLVTLEEEK